MSSKENTLVKENVVKSNPKNTPMLGMLFLLEREWMLSVYACGVNEEWMR